MALKSGEYVTKTTRRVIVWPAPDAQGDGAPVFVEQYDQMGRNIGRMKEKDKWGRDVKAYLPPEGFQNRPGYDNTPNWVLVDEHGGIYRQPNGEAVCIQPGQGLVINPDGSAELLQDEYAQYVFEQLHDSTTVADPEEESLVELSEEELLLRRLEEIRAGG